MTKLEMLELNRTRIRKSNHKRYIKLIRAIDNCLQLKQDCLLYNLRSNTDDNVCEYFVNEEPTLELNDHVDIYKLSDIDVTTFLTESLNDINDSIIDVMFKCGISDTFDTKENVGETIENDIIYIWSWEKYIGYCRNFHGFRIGRYNETESDLSDNTERTFYQSESIALKSDELVGLSKDEIIDKLEEELCTDSYKWNHFKNCLSREKIEEFVENNF